MKGLTFFSQLEIRLDVDGETFHQGDSIPCLLTIKNRGSAPLKIELPRLMLALGDMRKVKAKNESAFTEISLAEAAPIGVLPAGEQREVRWTFQLDQNCTVTDKAQSLYICYALLAGDEAISGSEGHLQLPVFPHRDIEGILGVLETSFQFDPRGYKSNKAGWVVAKLKAPKGSRYTSLEELDLAFRFDDGRLQLNYTFGVQRLAATPAALEVKKKSVKYAQELSRSEYMFSAGFVDAKLLEPKLEEALATLQTKRNPLAS